MKTGEIIHGFTVEKEEFIKEAGATLYTLSHKSGAALAYLAREDSNKTFAISFKTPPEDDTGVFHIIEHSTLCGSEKYPVKEPFVELLKGSLNTFLNAMTYEDRTVYPVSSRCDKDFYNLTSVYLDAVFKPKMLDNPFIFMQEGWRYEYDEEAGKLSYNGVVYNEMKGAYSSPDELGYAEISKLLYRGSSYGKDSGGDPAHIPELSYEEFCRLHAKYYHPSNSQIYLDGSVELSSILPLIDSYLSAFDPEDRSVSLSPRTEKGRKCSELFFEAGGEDAKARLILGYPFSDYSRTDEKLLSSIITSYLASSNDSPLVKALLDSGMCEDVILSANYSSKYTLTAEIKGFDKKDKDALLRIFDSVIEKECRGMDKAALTACLNRTEFKLRERELGSFPIGIANALAVYELWNYGGSPRDGLVFEEDIAKLREGIEHGAAESLLCRMIKDNPCSAKVLMLPSSTIAKERAHALEKQLSEKLAAFSPEELEELKSRQQRFTEWQMSEDSKEAVAALPKLSLSDISVTDTDVPTERYRLGGADIIRHRISTRGISYVSMFFDASDLKGRELSRLSLLCNLLTNLATEEHSVLALKNEIKSSLGALVATSSVISNSKEGFTRPVLKLTASALDTNAGKLCELISEVLLRTLYKDHEAIKKILKQNLSELEDVFTSNGEAVAMGRVEAMASPHGKVSELLHGYEYYLNLKDFQRELGDSPEEFLSELRLLSEKLFTRQRLTLSVSGEHDGIEKILVNSLKDQKDATRIEKIEANPLSKEAVIIPSGVGYATAGALLSEAKELLGPLRVARSILSYEYLWSSIRVKGGAYGAGFITRRDGGLFFYSYRDPSPERSINVFSESADFLKAFAVSRADLTKFIIGAYGEYDILKTPRTSAVSATADCLTGWTREDEHKLREGILKTSCDDLLRVVSLLEQLKGSCGIAVAASEGTIDSFENKFDEILKL